MQRIHVLPGRLCAAITLLIGLLAPSTAHPAPELSRLSVGSEYFRWREFDASGTRLLSEEGVRLSLHHLTRRQLKRFVFSTEVTLYSGSIDYDGQTQPPASQEVFSNTNYLGGNLRLSLSHALAGWSQAALPTSWQAPRVQLSVGSDLWQRFIYDTYLADGITPITGATERYRVIYVDAGLSATRKTAYGAVTLELGIRRPLAVAERNVELQLDLNSDGQWSMLGSMLVSYRALPGWFARLYYHSYRLARSNIATSPVDGLPYLQPESHADTLGIGIGRHF